MSSEAITCFPRPMSSDGQTAFKDTCVSPPGRLTDFSDEILLEQLRLGSKDALANLFRRYASLVRTIGCRILRSEAEAEDLVQEVFLYLFRRSSLFDARRSNGRSWIVQVTYHRAFDRRRYLMSRHFYDALELDESLLGPASTAGYEESVEGRLGRRTLGEIEESLSDNQRRVLELYFYEGLHLEEIAEAMGQTVTNIRNHYYRGLEKMRRKVFEAKFETRCAVK